MNSIKVDLCSFDGPDTVGGPLVWIQRFPTQLRKLGFDVRVKLLSWHDPAAGVALKTLRRDGFEVSVAKFGDTVSNIRWLMAEMKQQPPDIFVANHVVSAYYVAKYLGRCGIPTVGVIRSDDPLFRGLIDRFVFGRRDERVSGIVCVSDFLQQRVLERRPEFVEVRRIASGTPVPTKAAKPPDQKLRIAYVGRLVEEQKRVSQLARALIRATKEVEGVEAVLFGDGSARADVEQILAEERSCAVRMAGHINGADILNQLLDCHVIVLLSDYEGTPTAVMEGMACGCVPVCLRTRSGIPELVEDGVTGLLVNDRGDDFVKAIRRLRTEPGLWHRLSNAARRKIETGYSIQTCAKRWAELLELLHAKAGPKRPIEIPRRIKLPPPHSDFGGQDPRSSGPAFPVRLYYRTRMAAGRWRRRMLGQPIP